MLPRPETGSQNHNHAIEVIAVYSMVTFKMSNDGFSGAALWQKHSRA